MNQPQGTTRIIVGLDRAGYQDDAVLAAALSQARLTCAALSVVHAISPDTASTPGAADIDTGGDQRPARQARRLAATADLHRQLSRSAPGDDGPAVEYDVRHGDPATVLLAAAQHASLIVIGTRRIGGASPFLLGTVSQDVAVHATCPVLLVPTSGRRPPGRSAGAAGLG